MQDNVGRNPQSRTLTDGEIVHCRRLFGPSVDYARVRIHARGWFPFGWQLRHTAMAPDGHVWFRPEDFRPDFDREPAWRLLWFLHEMVHVWQWQLGYPVAWRGAMRLGLSYRYELAADKRLGDFNMEAQGDLLADWYALRWLDAPGALRRRPCPGALALFETVLADFLMQPADPANLPRCPRALAAWLRRRRVP
jgi:hypothetical protein